jgi:hypothetical protein
VRSGTSEAQNTDELFFMLRWARCGSHKKYTGTHYVKFVLLHLVGYAGHEVHRGAFGA